MRIGSPKISFENFLAPLKAKNNFPKYMILLHSEEPAVQHDSYEAMGKIIWGRELEIFSKPKFLPLIERYFKLTSKRRIIIKTFQNIEIAIYDPQNIHWDTFITTFPLMTMGVLAPGSAHARPSIHMNGDVLMCLMSTLCADAHTPLRPKFKQLAITQMSEWELEKQT